MHQKSHRRVTAPLVRLALALCVVVMATGCQSGIAVPGVMPTTTAATPDFSPFAQHWTVHWLSLIVTSAGAGQATWAAGVSCSVDPTPPCDDFGGQTLKWGGTATIRLSHIVDRTAYGVVVESNQYKRLRPGRVSLTLLPYDMAVFTYSGGMTMFCGPNFAQQAPDEIVADGPCGA